MDITYKEPFIEDFSYDLLKDRGWQKWLTPMKEGKVLVLCPLEDFDNIPDGIIMQSILGGKQYIKGLDKISKDVRGGMLAYGVLIEDPILKAVKKVIEEVKKTK